MGTNACEKAPSANRRRSRFGMRKATTKASIAKPAPKAMAMRVSRTNPVMRETSVIALTEAAAFRRFMGAGARREPRRAGNAGGKLGLCFDRTSAV